MDEITPEEAWRRLSPYVLVLEAVMRELPRDPEKAAEQMRALEALSKLSAPLSAIIEEQRAHAVQMKRNGERLTLYLQLAAVVGTLAVAREALWKWLRDGP